MNYTINVIGHGFVGSSIGYLFQQKNIHYNVFDIQKLENSAFFTYHHSLENLVKHSEFNSQSKNIYFICVPTPSLKSGECNTQIVQNTLIQLSVFITQPSYIVIKSTIPPNSTKNFSELIKCNAFVDLVFSPEFLREKTCHQDMYNTSFTLIGHETLNKTKCNDFKFLFEKILYNHNPQHTVYFYKSILCELFKYTINVYLAVKVWYFNEINEICKTFNVEYTQLEELFPLEPRLGNTHHHVPGHDGLHGFGGSCLPKETRALVSIQSQLGLPNTVLSEILKRNDTLRDSK